MFERLPKGLIKNENSLLLLGFFIVTAVFLPYIYWGEDVHTPIFDNLDSNIAWVKMVLDQGGPFLWPDTIIQQMMEGVPLSSLCDSYNISYLWFKLFGMFWGYVFSKYLVALIGFFGMYFLLRKHILPKDTPLYILLMVSVLFALLPFWSFTASVSGIPIAFYGFLNLRKGNISFINWLILLIYAFSSSLILVGLFLLICVSCIWLWDLINKKTVNKHLFAGIIFLSLMYIVSHIPLFYSFFIDNGFTSHRIDYQFSGEPGMILLEKAIYVLFYNDYNTFHSKSYHKFLLFPIILCLFLMLKNKKIDKLFLAVISFVVLSVILSSIYSWRLFSFRNVLNQIVPIDLSRILWFHPFCWYLLVAIAFYYLDKITSWGRYLCLIFITIQLCFIINSQPYITEQDKPTYKAFYAQSQFEDIKKYIGKDASSYKVVSIWLHPAIAQYNGFYTVDGFSVNYSLAYKHKFRKVIEKELSRNDETRLFFDTWGSWCYAFSAESSMYDLNHLNNKVPPIDYLDYNYDLLKEMGGEYIISSTSINTEKNTRLELLKVFDNDNISHWTIYLYEIK
ncbi:MAG: DUF6044 family protein [Dysgonomonas sp.]|nr:DUF6044 family protein [Dysgonomonas sp.]